jgi:TusA-related sulfurtransferase
MATTLDCRGLSCPQPVLLVLDALKSGSENELLILVDTETSRENVSRAVVSKGWRVSDVAADREGYSMSIRKE